jgi:murein DD-endopeptidase MepM/ murein hydrolase activator NlpD
VAVLSADKALSPKEWVSSTLTAGVCRLSLEIPARVRLWKWRAKHALIQAGEKAFPSLPLKRTHRVARRILPLLAVLGATVACSLVSKDGSSGKSLALGPMPELSKPKAAPKKEAVNPHAPWHYVLPIDHGIRSDASGQGHFRAPRFHGEHNGLDLLAPVGTPVFSPCEGEAMAGVSRSFGHWVHIICPVPEKYVQKGQAHPWASFFYAHLDKSDLPHNKWVSVQGAQALGQVGKSGNAQGPNVQPHLHLELIVQKNKRTAMDERHVGSDQSSVPAADFFAETLSSECMTPYGFAPKSQLLRRARRLDPFVALTCLSQKKPDFQKPPSPLTEASLAWTRFYVAKDFNVNLGVEDARVTRR